MGFITVLMSINFFPPKKCTGSFTEIITDADDVESLYHIIE